MLSANEVSRNVFAMRGTVFGTTKPHVADQMVQTLLCPFSSCEVLQALKSLVWAITLLNTIYKVYAQVLALHLQPLLPDIIHTS